MVGVLPFENLRRISGYFLMKEDFITYISIMGIFPQFVNNF
jgi:hypothetical protein